jgi:plasmid stability protein
MPSITLKNLPRALHRKLKTRARTHRRSLNKEVIATLHAATASARAVDAAFLQEAAHRSRALFKRPLTTREITAWKRSGRL